MKTRRIHWVWCHVCLALLAALAAGCNPQGGGPAELSGSLVLRILETDLRARTIVPAVTMEVASYDVEGLGPDSATFGGTGLSGGECQWDQLAPGQWSIVVDARNVDGVLIGSAAGQAEVREGETTVLSLTILPLGGQGACSISVSWPASTITSPGLFASLMAEDGSQLPIQFTLSGETATWSGADLEAGYYSLTLQLFDGSTLAWGRSEVVRILAGQATSAQYVLTTTDMNGTSEGGVILEVAVELMNPSQITLTGARPILSLHTDMTVGAQAGTQQDSWQWFLNGTLLTGQTGASITLGSTLPPGNYWLDVIARKAAVMSSGHVFFQVSTLPPAVSPSVGELVINEVMIDPAGVADTSGEWFEICNVTSKLLDIEGLVIRTSTQFVAVANSGAGIVIRPGEYLVFCRNGDPSLNGQVPCAYAYGSGITLANSGGSLALAEPGTNGLDGTVIDAMQWTAATAGKSFSLGTSYRTAVDNDIPANWYWSSQPCSATDMGTPGAANEQ